MAITFELNGKKYRFPKLDFNAVADLSENGVDIMNPRSMAKKPIPTARAIVAWALDVDIDTAGDYIQQHLLNGGDLAQVFEGLNNLASESDFFKRLAERNKKEELGIEDHKPKRRGQAKNQDTDLEVVEEAVTEEEA